MSFIQYLISNIVKQKSLLILGEKLQHGYKIDLRETDTMSWWTLWGDAFPVTASAM